MNEPKHTPPQWVLNFVRWICPPQLFESVEGDLLEQFKIDIEHIGNYKKAKRKFIWNALAFCRPGIVLRNRFTLQLINTIMLGSYLKIASRNMAKRKVYTLINAIGLSIAISFCTLIYLFIQDELSFDQFHENKSRIYRIEEKSFDTWEHDSADPFIRSAYLQLGLKQALKDELPEVEYATRYNAGDQAVVRYNDNIFTERVTFVDNDFFRMFSFPMISGNKDKLFDSPSETVITPEMATKYFGTEDPIGKTLSMDIEGEKLFTVAGIIEAPPANSSFDFIILVPQQNRPWYERNLNQWGNFSTPTFVQLKPNADLVTFKTNLDKVIEKFMSEKLEKWRNESTIPIPADVKMLEYEFTVLPDIHLKKEINWTRVSDKQYSYILGGIALLILLIAAINYISLSLTSSASRRTEVGIRKVAGAQQSQLIWQFTLESVLLSFLSMLIGIGLIVFFLPFFNEFTKKEIVLTGVNIVNLIGVAMLASLVIGVLAGSYPSWFLSHFRPAIVLKGKFTSKLQAGFTKPLVVLQFAISAFLIISSVIMYRQMKFITTKDLGYNKEQVLVIPTQSGWNAEANKTIQQFRLEAEQEPVIISVGGTSASFSQGYSRYGYRIDGEQKSAYVYAVDPYYVPTLGIELLEGRNFDEAIPTDTNTVIINEALAKDMKWENPIDQFLNWQEDTVTRGARVIGVTRDYHFSSLEKAIEPMFMTMDAKNAGYTTTMLVKVAKGDIPTSVERVKGLWKKLFPEKPFDYSFLDEDVAKQYQSYERWMNIMGLATLFAIFISCLGLFGLAGINAVNRTKEIGIRKVMGAQTSTIFMLLNKQYVWLALIAFVAAAPASWYAMSKWLSDFQFRISMSWELFALSMVLGLFIALLAVSYHAVKASFINPAETLKYE
ncbi:MAG: FtsX-like permease family protein [Flammeovirgaceae bacterium]|nr:FtsX-like permease family protein [Flammeovirgaceae bacterium]